MADVAERDYTEELLDNPERISRCVAVFFYGRSGSYLLSSFLDGHPHVLETVPGGVQEVHLAFSRIQQELPSGTTTPRMLVEKVCEYLPELFGTTIGMGRLANDRAVDRERFAQLMMRSIASVIQRGKPITSTVLFSAIHIAYHVALELPLRTSDPIIVWNFHVPSEQRRQFVRMLYPQARFLICIRNPWQTLDSHFHTHFTEYPIRPFSTLSGLLVSQLLSNGELFPGEDPKTLAGVRFEDLHARTETVMRAVSDWIGIPWHPNLLVSSFNGEIWWHKKDGVEFTGARPAQARPQPTKHLTFLDKLLIGWVLAKEFSTWRYDNSFYEKNKDLLKPLVEDVLINLPTGMELAALRSELWDLLRAFWNQRRSIAELLRNERTRREDPAFKILPILGLEDSP